MSTTAVRATSNPGIRRPTCSECIAADPHTEGDPSGAQEKMGCPASDRHSGGAPSGTHWQSQPSGPYWGCATALEVTLAYKHRTILV
jgi:hypothetical protein